MLNTVTVPADYPTNGEMTFWIGLLIIMILAIIIIPIIIKIKDNKKANDPYRGCPKDNWN